MTGKALKRTKRLTNIRVKNFRQRAKQVECVNEDPAAPGTPSTSSGSFASRQSLGKAVKRVAINLPKSPRKLKFVASKIAAIACLQLSQTPTTAAPRDITQQVKDLVIQFYKQDDISRQLPGWMDVINVKDPLTGEKTTIPKRLMNLNLREAFAVFKETHPDVQIGLSKFCTLRPKEVNIVSSKSHEVCCCPYCENMNFLFNASRWKDDTNIKQMSDLLATMVCDTANPACMKCLCKDCPSATDMSATLRDLMDDDRDELLVKMWKGGGALEIKEWTVNEQ